MNNKEKLYAIAPIRAVNRTYHPGDIIADGTLTAEDLEELRAGDNIRPDLTPEQIAWCRYVGRERQHGRHLRRVLDGHRVDLGADLTPEERQDTLEGQRLADLAVRGS